MAAFTKNAISEMVRDTAKRTKIWDHIQIVIRADFVSRFTILVIYRNAINALIEFYSCYKGHT